MVSATMKANESGTMGVAMTHTKKDVVDIAKQCPGDKFYMDCKRWGLGK